MNFRHPAWKQAPVRTLLKVAKSLVRRRLPALRRAVVAYDGGRSRIEADLGTAMGLALYRYGHVVGDSDIELVRRLLRPGDVFVDGGANIGLFSLVAARSVGPSGKVVAFEPAPATRAALRGNLELNALPWVEVRPDALGARPGTLELVTFTGDRSGLSSFNPADAAGGRKEQVRVVTLDEALGEAAVKVRLLKLDLEGAEYGALQGASGLLGRAKPDLIIELEPEHLRRQGASAEAVVALLRGQGYAFYRIEDDARHLMLVSEPTPERPRAHPNLFATADLSRVESSGVRVRG
jgi:FkbM family methyltransferase